MYIKVKVTAGARAESFEKIGDDAYEASVREKARAGAANARVLELVRENLGPAASIRIVSGHQSPSKIISVDVRRP